MVAYCWFNHAGARSPYQYEAVIATVHQDVAACNERTFGAHEQRGSLQAIEQPDAEAIREWSCIMALYLAPCLFVGLVVNPQPLTVLDPSLYVSRVSVPIVSNIYRGCAYSRPFKALFVCAH